MAAIWCHHLETWSRRLIEENEVVAGEETVEVLSGGEVEVGEGEPKQTVISRLVSETMQGKRWEGTTKMAVTAPAAETQDRGS